MPIGAQGEIYDADLAGRWISPMHPQIIRDEPGPCPICGMDLVPTTRYGYSNEPLEQPAVLHVPRSAVLMAGDNSVVYVETEPGRFELRPVDLGPHPVGTGRNPQRSGSLEQVFVNILLNAVDAINEFKDDKKEKRISIETALSEDEAIITFTDTGSGISEENISKIFEPFFTTKSQGKGTGLGLWVSYGIIKSFLGNIEVKSNPEQGTTFTVILPVEHIKDLKMTEKILVVDDEDIIRESLSFILKKEKYEVEEAANGKIAFDMLKETSYDLVITDIEMPEMKGIELLDEIKKMNLQTNTIVITAYGSMETAIAALRSGASDYILKPVEFDELLFKVKKLFEVRDLHLENRILRKELQREYDYNNIVGKSPAITQIFEMIKAVADTDSTVLISGNSGTGKELVARALHFNSKRTNKPFIALNCGAISENLIESELFGHKKGAFTGAISDKEGFIKAAESGTLFLDEISEMPPQLQVKLLRAIQEKEYTPVGTTVSLPVNVRFIASTNRNLLEYVSQGKFREDLFYRLNVVDIHLPSLKERESDIPLLADFFLDKYRRQMNKNIKGISNDAMRSLMNHEWKGEIRELENVIERSVIFCNEDFINVKHLPVQFQTEVEPTDFFPSGSLDESVKRFEKDIITRALEANDFNKEKTADELQVGLSTLYRKMKELDIQI